MLWTKIAAAQTIAWKGEGETRLEIIYAPWTKSAGEKAPLVFSFHGHGDDIQNFQYTGIHRMWPEAVVVYFRVCRAAMVFRVGRWKRANTTTAISNLSMLRSPRCAEGSSWTTRESTRPVFQMGPI